MAASRKRRIRSDLPLGDGRRAGCRRLGHLDAWHDCRFRASRFDLYRGHEVSGTSFMRSTLRLVPLIAHDRAGFGGAMCVLPSAGIALFSASGAAAPVAEFMDRALSHRHHWLWQCDRRSSGRWLQRSGSSGPGGISGQCYRLLHRPRRLTFRWMVYDADNRRYRCFSTGGGRAMTDRITQRMPSPVVPSLREIPGKTCAVRQPLASFDFVALAFSVLRCRILCWRFRDGGWRQFLALIAAEFRDLWVYFARSGPS